MKSIRFMVIILGVVMPWACFITWPGNRDNAIEETLRKKDALPMATPVTWAFIRIKRTDGTIDSNEVSLSKFNEIFADTPSPDSCYSLTEALYHDAISNVLMVFMQYDLAKHGQKEQAAEDFLAYKLFHAGDSLVYVFDLKKLPKKIHLLDSVLVNKYLYP